MFNKSTETKVIELMTQDILTRAFTSKFAAEYQKTGNVYQSLNSVLPDYVPGYMLSNIEKGAA